MHCDPVCIAALGDEEVVIPDSFAQQDDEVVLCSLPREGTIVTKGATVVGLCKENPSFKNQGAR